MATVNYSLRVDEADKQRAEQVFRSLGMSFSTGINIYLKTVGRQQKIPFPLALDKQAAETTITKAIRADKERAFHALNGILAGHNVNLDQEREERVNS
ncbi:MAG: type II toxin-antitoxin system RelB/DinJ family antitoxin [Peptococcaceae bacterium]|jgi:addiction module RelB/DinJ family antitoxin|nr:type II toxin-antitoxin system RelB/DinJ family antitoxin [Peptococcaceae bacterium]